MRRTRPGLQFLLVAALVLGLGAGLTLLFRQFVVPTGGDQVFAPLWEASQYASGGREMNPYSPAAVQRAKILLGDEEIAPGFIYPYYSIALFGPVSLISPYSLARAVWMTFSITCAVGLAFTALMLTRWRPGPVAGVVFALFAMGSLPVVRAVYVGNPALVAGLLIGVGMQLTLRERDGLAGVFFGLALIKPTLVAFLLPFVLVWAVSRRRMGLVWGMLGTSVVLLGVSIFLFPQWLAYYYFQGLAQIEATFPFSPAAVIWAWLPDLGPRVMLGTTILIGIGLLLAWWQALGKGPRWFLWTAAFTLAVTMLIGVPVSLSDQALLVIPFSLAFSGWSQRGWRGGGVAAAMGLLLAAGWAGWWLTMGMDLTAPVSDLMLFLLPVAAVVSLLWVRYWALHSIQIKTSHLEALRRL